MKPGWLLGISMLALAGCSSDSDDNNELDAIELASPALQTCFDTIRKAYGWTRINQVEVIACDEPDVATLDGIEQFPNLVQLNITSEQLTQVQLANSLIYAQLESPVLSEVDLTSASSLRYLLLGSPKLGDVDLAAVPGLSGLLLDQLPLTQLDLSLVPELDELVLKRLPLTTLDLRPVPLLDLLQLDGNEALSQVRFGDQVYLNEMALRDSPLLSSLDLSALTGLQLFYATGTGLTGLDLTYNTELSVFEAPGNQFTMQRFDYNTELRYLDLSDNPLSEDARQYLMTLDWVDTVKY
ncbi:hypothetical protein Fbal_1294 [Ferrimonas balearica DSM 9799]|uniref:Leucine-rich repeat domain-containing protein n=1 Tax=Ferrimonas balearica (strain DSM 9799 / CCM 4581 / KCTC 23876 / PAT) TaxID=550540 RepID=E1SLW8_FERBD|nr:hypothetical protein [Ferrimonas balearica]ADN75500.1 hypothetical protein Fbal_1294 [Ferrimonas balearica DSM 9799]